MTRVLDDNPVYRRDLRTWVTGRKVVRVIWAVVLAGGLLALSVAKFGYPEFAIYTFPSLWILLWLLGWFFVSWAPPALTGGVFATEAERGTLTGLVLSPFPVRKLIWGYLVSRTRTLLAGFVLFVLLLTLSPLAFVDTLEGGAAKLMGLLNPFPVRTAAAPQGAGSVLSEVPAPPEDVDVRGHLWATLPWIGAGSLVVGIVSVLFAAVVGMYASIVVRSSGAAIALAYAAVFLLPCVFGMFLMPLGMLQSAASAGSPSMMNSVAQGGVNIVLDLFFKLGIILAALLSIERKLKGYPFE